MKDITYTIVTNGGKFRLRSETTGQFAELPYQPWLNAMVPQRGPQFVEFDTRDAADDWRKQNEWRAVE